jgi:hypothetical protein
LSGFIRLPTEGYTQGGRFCVMPYVLYDGLYCLDVDLVILVLRGSLPALIYPGGQGYMNPSLILA